MDRINRWRVGQPRTRFPRALSPTTVAAAAAVIVAVASASRPARAQIDPWPTPVKLEDTAGGFVAPIAAVHSGDGSKRLFVVDQIGKIHVIRDGQVLPAAFLDLTAKIVPVNPDYDERGLLGLAFHPRYEQNGRFFVRYSAPRAGDVDEPCNDPEGFIVGCHEEVLAEYRVSAANPDIADPSSEVILFRVDKPQFNHNGGAVVFGPDGFLYFGLGDGGGAHDGLADTPPSHGPLGNGQNTETALGSLLRIDVDGARPFEVPADNPFIGGGGLDTIYAYGFRNPYTFSFDRETGDLYVADVGQNLFEEVDIVTKGGNYGWAIREGAHCFDAFNPTTPPASCATEGLIDPMAEYSHAEGLAVVGGFVYRGSLYPQLDGLYIFGDFSRDFGPTGRLFGIDLDGDPSKIFELKIAAPAPPGFFVKGFGEDEDGEIYAVISAQLGLTGTTGKVVHITPRALPFRRADSNGDGKVDLSDAVHVLGHLFLGSPEKLDCRDAGDSNADGALDLTDAIFALGYLFLGGAEPPAPGPTVCGVPPAGPSAPLGCRSYAACAPVPEITAGPSADPAAVDEGGTTGVSVSAVDPGGATLTYEWTQVSPDSPAGTFADAAAPSTTWTAPLVGADTAFTLRVVISSGGAETEGEVVVTVRNTNRPPVQDGSPTATPPSIAAGDATDLSVLAADPDGDALTYSWEQTDPPAPAGTFVSGPTAASARWRAPAVSSETVFTLRVSISDGATPAVQGSVQVTVTVPGYAAKVQPVFTQNCSCHLGPFPSAGLTLAAGQSYADLVDVAASACAPLKRVLPGDPDQSVLVRKVLGTTCGGRMPAGDPGFFDRNPGLVDRMRSWILAGAAND